MTIISVQNLLAKCHVIKILHVIKFWRPLYIVCNRRQQKILHKLTLYSIFFNLHVSKIYTDNAYQLWLWSNHVVTKRCRKFVLTNSAV
jgi:hypothetical protein